jgi:zinc transporter 9
MNQILLMIGISRSTRAANPRFPFGYGAERAVWALMSAVGIFFLGCGVTLYHGVHTLLHPRPLEDLRVALVVLLVSFVVEAIVLVIAVRTVRQNSADRPFFRYLWREADPTTTAVVLEDSAACLGVIFALIGIATATITGNPVWDAMASIAVGLLLGAIAIWLVARSRYLLVGPAVPPEVRTRIHEIVASSPVVERIALLRTRVMDTESFRVAADVEFDGEVLAEWMEDDIRAAYSQISSYDEFRTFAARYAERVVDRLGDEVDAIEAAIQSEFPKARYLDIEAQ